MPRHLALLPLAAALAATATLAAAPAWKVLARPPRPAAGWDGGAAGRVTLLCDTVKGPSYSVRIVGRANGLRPGDWVSARVEGGRKVKVHVTVKVDARGWATLSSYGRLSGYANENEDVFQIADAFKSAKKPVTVTAGPMRMTIPADGVAAAMAPMIKTCGDPGKLARKVRQRSEPM